VGAIRTPLPHQPADENLNSRRGTKEAGQACVPRKKYELPRGAINLPRKEQGRASHSLSVEEPVAGFIFFKRNICMPRHPHNLKARHPHRKRDSCKYKSNTRKTMTGKIIKGIAGFYYVYVEETKEAKETATGGTLYECKAKGTFRKQKIKPLVGDIVDIAVLDDEKHIGNVERILPRKNELIRPAVSNIDMALVIFASAKPDPNFNLLDRFLCMMEYQHVPVTICFNKKDLITPKEQQELKSIYEPAGYRVLFTSTKTGEGIDEIKHILEGRTTTVAGPSGVGKSSIINCLQDDVQMETGHISEKIERGKHTTRHSEIIPIKDGTYIMDTPGFSSMDVPGFEKEDLWTCYPEFVEYEPYCRFQGCSHINEPDCGVKEALADGKISQVRYDNYKLLYEELKNRQKY